MKLVCPVTGLKVFSRPEWKNRKVSSTFEINFYIIGKSIIYSAPAGFSDIEGVRNSIAIKKEIKEQILKDNKHGHYIQIQDYSRLKGSSQAARSYFTKDANEDDNLKSMIFCNLSSPLSIAVKIGKRFNSARKIVHVSKQYDDAIKWALNLSGRYNLKQDFVEIDDSIRFNNLGKSLVPVELLSNESWDINTPEYSNQIYIINKSIFYSIAKGTLESTHIPLHSSRRELFLESLPEGADIKYILTDGSQVKASSKARIEFLQYLKEWHNKSPIQMYIIFGANFYMRTVAKMAKPFLPFKVKVTRDFRESFDLIRKDELATSEIIQDNPEPIDPNIINLLAYISNINWADEGLKDNVDLDEQHPFYLLYQSVRLVKEELDSLFNNRKKTEKALQIKNEQLQLTLSELEQTHEILIRQERLAALGQLSAGVAHDFNNILSIILGYSELIQLSLDSPEDIKSHLKHIVDSTNRASYLVRQLLDYSRKTIQQTKQIDLAFIIRESLQTIKNKIPQNIKINQNIEEYNLLINADPVQLQQMITNLVLNARDAMPNGGELGIRLSQKKFTGDIKCILCDYSIKGEWIKLEVTDTGSGISEEVLPRIFEPFYSTKGVGKGTGLGLSQVAGIVGQHSGHIRVETHVDQGSAFIIYLPVE